MNQKKKKKKGTLFACFWHHSLLKSICVIHVPVQTALLVAVTANQAEIVQDLLSLGADINACDINGQTALHLASHYGFPGVLQVKLHDFGFGMTIYSQSEQISTVICFLRQFCQAGPPSTWRPAILKVKTCPTSWGSCVYLAFSSNSNISASLEALIVIYCSSFQAWPLCTVQPFLTVLRWRLCLPAGMEISIFRPKPERSSPACRCCLMQGHPYSARYSSSSVKFNVARPEL